MLHDFISKHRQELIERARARHVRRTESRPTGEQLPNGLPQFLTQLSDVLENQSTRSDRVGSEMGSSASQHGSDLLTRGLTIGQVVHDYGDLCQVITELAVELNVPIDAQDFRTLNRCLDDAIASAVTEYSRQTGMDASGAEVMRQGFFAHELRNHLNTAMLAFDAVKTGKVGVAGSTFAVLERSLRGLNVLIDRSLSEVRVASATRASERLHVATFLEEAKDDVSIAVKDRGIQFRMELVDRDVFVEVDRHPFASAIANLLQNAFKFTRAGGHVWIRTRATRDRVVIEVEDECGGLLPGIAEAIFQPYEQRGPDREGLGLGLSISRQAIEADGGTISVRDNPGKGCVFVVDMPRAVEDAPAGQAGSPGRSAGGAVL